MTKLTSAAVSTGGGAGRARRGRLGAALATVWWVTWPPSPLVARRDWGALDGLQAGGAGSGLTWQGLQVLAAGAAGTGRSSVAEATAWGFDTTAAGSWAGGAASEGWVCV